MHCEACKNNQSIRKQISALVCMILNFLVTEIKSEGKFFFTTPSNLWGTLAYEAVWKAGKIYNLETDLALNFSSTPQVGILGQLNLWATSISSSIKWG